jgi:hypothetical protein
MLPTTPVTPPDVLDGAVTTVTGFAGEYGTQVLVVLGISVAIGLGIWGFMKLVGLFRKSAK